MVIFQKVHALVNNRKLFQGINDMNDLFTFNSQQFQAIQVPPIPPASFRKRIIKTSETKRGSSVFTSISTSEGNRNSQDKIEKSNKKVSFEDSTQLTDESGKLSPQSDRVYVSEELDDKVRIESKSNERESRIPLFKKFSIDRYNERSFKA